MNLKLFVLLAILLVIGCETREIKLRQYEKVEERKIKPINSEDLSVTLLRFSSQKCPAGGKRDKSGNCKGEVQSSVLSP